MQRRVIVNAINKSTNPAKYLPKTTCISVMGLVYNSSMVLFFRSSANILMVRAGSKNDPEDATGLAHYLEHMLFKGTDVYGSLDYEKEKPLLEKIEALLNP